MDGLGSDRRGGLRREPLNPRKRHKEHPLGQVVENLSGMTSESVPGEQSHHVQLQVRWLCSGCAVVWTSTGAAKAEDDSGEIFLLEDLIQRTNYMCTSTPKLG